MGGVWGRTFYGGDRIYMMYSKGFGGTHFMVATVYFSSLGLYMNQNFKIFGPKAKVKAQRPIHQPSKGERMKGMENFVL